MSDGVALLQLHLAEVNAARVDTYRCARLHTVRAYAERVDRFCQPQRRRLCNASSGQHFPPDVEHAVEECSRGDDDSGSHDVYSPECPHARHAALRPVGQGSVLLCLCQQLHHLVLPDVEARCRVELVSPLPYEALTVTLCAWRPHGRSLGAVQHAELYRCAVSDDAHPSAQGVNLTYYLPLRYAADGRVARHLCNLVHIHRDEACVCAETCCSCRRLTSRVSRSYHYDIILQNHLYALLLCVVILPVSWRVNIEK